MLKGRLDSIWHHNELYALFCSIISNSKQRGLNFDSELQIRKSNQWEPPVVLRKAPHIRLRCKLSACTRWIMQSVLNIEKAGNNHIARISTIFHTLKREISRYIVFQTISVLFPYLSDLGYLYPRLHISSKKHYILRRFQPFSLSITLVYQHPSYINLRYYQMFPLR